MKFSTYNFIYLKILIFNQFINFIDFHIFYHFYYLIINYYIYYFFPFLYYIFIYIIIFNFLKSIFAYILITRNHIWTSRLTSLCSNVIIYIWTKNFITSIIYIFRNIHPIIFNKNIHIRIISTP